MARFVALFRDDPAADWVRKRHDRDHFAYLEANQNRILLAGGLRPGPGEWYCGGLWILDVADRDEAVRLVENDPYYGLGLRLSYELFAWGKAPCYGAVTL